MTLSKRNQPCWCGSKKKWKHCHFPQIDHRQSALPDVSRWGISLKTAEQIAGIRRACQIAVMICDELCERAQVGTRLCELEEYSRARHREVGAIPAPLHYGTPPFPASICTSLNEVVCHGIPDQTRLQVGDILNVDVTVNYQGYFGDCSKMCTLLPMVDERIRVVETSLECLRLAIDGLRPGGTVGEIGSTIAKHAEAKKCGVVDIFVGHGIGLNFHEPPNIPHFANRSKIPLVPGMVFTIEPMINAGVKDVDIDSKDQWTARTRDRRASAQWEHTLLITESGAEVLTPWRGW